ncbi:MAG: dihydrolipoamide acetyltransferase family protein [Tepidiformaceae bacterium]
MATEVTMPQMGADMTEGTVVRWLKQPGDVVARGDIIAEIETDKATVEMEAFEAGTLIKLVAEEGQTVPVGEVIALIGEADEDAPEVEPKPPAETPPRRTSAPAQPAPAPPEAEAAGEQAAPQAATAVAPPPMEPEQAVPQRAGGANGAAGSAAGGRLRISPVARRIASDAGIDVSRIQGSGPDGRVLRRDVETAMRAGELPAPSQEAAAPAAKEAVPAAVAGAPKPAAATAPAQRPAEAGRGDVTQPLSRMRQAIARRMTQSKQQQPHYYLTLDIDMTAAMDFRKQLNASASDEQRVSVNDLVVKACALALERHPKFNAEYTDEGLEMHERINIDIGIALDDGLIAPAILDCAGKTLGAIAAEAKDLVERAKGGKLRADEYSAGTFTITNLGAYGVEALIGIINPPQAAILGVGSVMSKAVVLDGEVAVRQVMKVALSADHRVTDGAEGARFIKEIQGFLENPVSLAL